MLPVDVKCNKFTQSVYYGNLLILAITFVLFFVVLNPIIARLPIILSWMFFDSIDYFLLLYEKKDTFGQA